MKVFGSAMTHKSFDPFRVRFVLAVAGDPLVGDSRISVKIRGFEMFLGSFGLLGRAVSFFGGFVSRTSLAR